MDTCNVKHGEVKQMQKHICETVIGKTNIKTNNTNNMETLERVITEELQKIPSKKHLKAIDILVLLKETEDISYESLVDDDLGSLVKFLIAVGKNYGKAQWTAGAEAIRNAIVEDVNFPPQYVA